MFSARSIRYLLITTLSLLLWQSGGRFASANPIVSTTAPVTQGAATFNSSGSQLTINAANNTFINWQSFNIGVGETTTFVQPSSSSLVWNNIGDANPSQILGTLNANGYVVLQNPNGFYVGGQAAISAHGLIMTTASTPAFNLSSGGAWEFDAPPPSAKIYNYGKINIAGGGSAFLIADDIENNGTISAPGGKIGLYAGEKVLVSTSPDGRGLSTEVTLPAGVVNNQGQLTADGGSIALNAQTVNQSGLIQANSAQNVNGTIELVASDTVNLNANSTISAEGSSQAASAGGVTVQAGSTVNNNGQVVADASSILMKAPAVNQNGTLQANSLGSMNGAVGIDASASLTLGSSSDILANGDTTVSSASPGGFAVLYSGNTFADTSGSIISVAGNSAGGQNGVVEIFGNGVTAGSLQSSYGNPYALLINPTKLTLSTGATSTSASSPNLNLNALLNYSQVYLYNIELASQLNLGNATTSSTLNWSAMNNITVDNSLGVSAGNNWNVSLTAGTGFIPTAAQPAPLSGSDGIYLDGSAYIQSQNGNISLWAAKEVQVGWSGTANQPGTVNPGTGAIRTVGGGNIEATAEYGNVNTGSSTSGFYYISKAPYFSPFSIIGFGNSASFGTSSILGGISTAAGGNVTINAGGDVVSYLPFGTGAAGSPATGDAGTGAFGSQPGNVTINAGGSVYGHYVVVNGAGTINASQNIGNASKNVALSLVTGSWNLDAPNGNIYLQEVRNPNGDFNVTGSAGSGGHHFFDYDPSASVSLTAGIGVYLTGQNLPRTSDSINLTVNMPIILPPTLEISAGSGGVTLENDLTLFPSSDGNGGLQITTTDGGNFNGEDASGNLSGHELLMSDSSQTHWFNSDSGTQPFSALDHGSAPSELNNPDPVLINIAGSMNNITLQTSKETQITVGGNMTGCSFYGENLNAGDVTSITVAGQIFNPGSFNYVTLDQGIQNLPLAYLPPDTLNNWQTLLTLAVDPARVAALTIPSGVDPSQYASYVNGLLLFGDSLQSSFAYDPTTQRLTFIGSMSQSILNALDQPLTVLVYGPNGYPLVDSTGHFETASINWVDPAKIQTLYTLSQGTPSLGNSGGGYVIGGTGEFDVTAGSISLGNSYGILSLGNGQLVGANYSYLTSDLQTQPGATINVTVGSDVTVNDVTTSSLNMPSSTIAALGGGDVNVKSTGGSMDLGSQYLVQFESQIMSRDNLGLGIYTSGGGNVNVTAQGNINVDSSRIATFDGGDIFIESFTGNVDAGSGGAVAIPVNVFSSQAGFLNQPFEYVYANGIVAQTLVNASQIPGSASVPGNITVITPQGSIYASEGGILQEALNGNISAGPTIDLEAGTPNPVGDWSSTETPLYIGNIDLGNSGVIGGTVDVKATGKITGLVISRQNSNVTAPTVGGLTVLAGGTANVSAQNSGSGSGITIIGGQGVNASGIGSGATLLGQNVSVNGGAAQSTLGTATATSASQSAAGTASNDAKQQVAGDNTNDDDQKKKKHPKLQRIKRVTVLLSKAN